MIVVAGGTGMLGTLLVRRLVDRHVAVRVLTRELNRARHFGHLPVEIVRADVRDPGTLTAAVEGAETVVSAIHGFVGSGVSPMSIDQTGNSSLIDAAAKVGASFVLMSVVGARRSSPFELFRAKYAAEEHMQSTAVEGTVVRATALEDAGQTKQPTESTSTRCEVGWLLRLSRIVLSRIVSVPHRLCPASSLSRILSVPSDNKTPENS